MNDETESEVKPEAKKDEGFTVDFSLKEFGDDDFKSLETKIDGVVRKCCDAKGKITVKPLKESEYEVKCEKTEEKKSDGEA